MYRIFQTAIYTKVLKLLKFLYPFLHITVIFGNKESKVAFFTVFVYFRIIFLTWMQKYNKQMLSNPIEQPQLFISVPVTYVSFTFIFMNLIPKKPFLGKQRNFTSYYFVTTLAKIVPCIKYFLTSHKYSKKAS